MNDLIVLSDYGLDDAVALVYLLNNNKWHNIHIVAIAGNEEASVSLSNAHKLLVNYINADSYTESDDNRAAREAIVNRIVLVDTSSKQQNCAHLPSIHGNDGMGDLFESSISTCKVMEFDSWLETLSRSICYDIASLGPATLVRPIIAKLQALELVPIVDAQELINNKLANKDSQGTDKDTKQTKLGKFKSATLNKLRSLPLISEIGSAKQHTILFMGHCIEAEPNFKGEEFNYKLDEEAFEWCINNVDCVVATLDTCRHQYFNLANAVVRSNSKVFDTVVNKAIDLAVARHSDNAFVYDYIAVRYLVEPKNFDVIPAKTRKGNMINQLNASVGNN